MAGLQSDGCQCHNAGGCVPCSWCESLTEQEAALQDSGGVAAVLELRRKVDAGDLIQCDNCGDAVEVAFEQRSGKWLCEGCVEAMRGPFPDDVM